VEGENIMATGAQNRAAGGRLPPDASPPSAFCSTGSILVDILKFENIDVTATERRTVGDSSCKLGIFEELKRHCVPETPRLSLAC
jgi:hypothetical protein